METEKNKKGYIRVGHLVYIIIIAVIVLAFFLVFALGDSKTASTTIGTASTVSSLILSVIAIVMTLIDVAGQRQSMLDLKETADKLQKSNESATDLTEKLMAKIIELQEMKEQMVEAITESSEWRKELIGKIEGLKQKGDYKPEDVEKIMKDMEDALEAKKAVLGIGRNYVRTANSDLDITEIIKSLKKKYNKGEKIERILFGLNLGHDYNITYAMVQKIIKDLSESGYISVNTNQDGTSIVTFNSGKVSDDAR
ncbi:hypothetical protein FQP34_22055 [Peribacillus simplex]|uniref:Uncharacterized protein n=1 Tax=Peribacillus simplex TaxID=1478 RepID=A0A8B5XU68_9BACI|nr:hypothetical protein [Peribacillus simplex]TVX77819.1 hypothetical protein FQP34_22055 [Peribacillus simplex]